MTLVAGRRLGPYEILATAGSGGMGEVYKARDTRLDRIVAIKVLPEALLKDPDRRQRLEREARAVSRLSHPHICTLHDVGHQDGVDYLVMEYLEGGTLAERLKAGPLPPDEALRRALEVAGALDAAHRHGIVHRDLKPGNIMLTPAGAKLLDFGLAKMAHQPSHDQDQSAAPTMGPDTRVGAIVGTPGYMSPEQIVGRPADARTDVFTFGLVLYEMLTGRRAFAGDSHAQVQAAILRDTPPSARGLRSEVGEAVERILQRCLQKDPAARFQDASSLLEALKACEARAAAPAGGRRLARRPVFSAIAAAAVMAAIAFSAWTWWHGARERRARRAALPEIARLSASDQLMAAYGLARRMEPLLRGDPSFDKLWRDVSTPIALITEPAGADVRIRDYGDPNADWIPLGVTPLANVRVPHTQLRWQIVKEGFETLDLGVLPRQPSSVTLVARGQAPAGMVRVSGGRHSYRATRAVDLQDYWLDRFEVTNRQFKEFVDKGGYANRSYWKHPFVRAGRVLGFDEAMALFRDATGRPAPSTWELGSYPEGQGDYPVAGVSWYEAAAYAEFAGRSLPTFHHWFHAAGADLVFSGILRLSNFSGKGPSTVGSHEGVSPWGSHDMAGNVREWVFNAAGDRRYTLGGSWNDPTYLFTGPDALDPFDRSAVQGFRCALYSAPLSDEVTGPIETIYHDYSKDAPVSDAIFAAYRGLHRYDPGPLDVRTESLEEDDAGHWKEERVSFAAAYGDERIPAILFLPKNTAPPYQAVIYFPPGSSRRLDSIRDTGTRQFAYLIRSGRAVLFPSYKGTFERRLPQGAGGPNAARDLVIQWSKDVGRSLDFLEDRPDIDGGRLAYYGLSMGAAYGPIVGAVESRFRAMVLVAGGLDVDEGDPPEVNAINFAPRVRAPVLMINGSHDFLFPLETSQKPLFRLLGPADDAKVHYVFEGGHVPPRLQEVARETLDWLDRHLGPVRTADTP